MKTPILVSTALLAVVALAAGPAQAQAPAATDPCAEHRELEGIRYTFRLQRQGQDPVVVVFTYSRCSVEDRTADGDPVTPVATRTYTGNFGGYSLHLSHELGDNSVGLGLTQSENGGATFLIAASFDSKPAADLTRGTVNLGDVRMMDWRVPRGQELRGTGSLEAAAAR